MKKWNKMKRVNNKAFTLLEMLIVLIIVGILMAIIMPNITGQKDKIETQAKRNIAQIVETQVNTYKLVEQDDNVTLTELQAEGYLTAKQVDEATRLLEIGKDSAISVPIAVE
ncbi:prepilin-type N-terminal cleavage/methylation domain-containing protein [Aerococcaceae bacterium NML191292]|nr:prepilin-type N-terminal cleavage/methylation domain-containing protein [Aerococcaceae bacterium NML210727]MCW6654551.1 prepilin-type N-terminal cleavage/methylation domain-containing protein [Aerococcaceae bacterium NML201296]MCW6659172.1 prepilin-type N-terminal cleavage/methylation domain-containing protein [Aerococcaceae bacterium NML191292]MCW6662502.1 prepilin-type N-terminal cleavage/methylation domain-containing protein [Aerococcaceae bacterium NML190073]MCW6665982.1 prepilin-type N-